jgi:hypothetical protein
MSERRHRKRRVGVPAAWRQNIDDDPYASDGQMEAMRALDRQSNKIEPPTGSLRDDPDLVGFSIGLDAGKNPLVQHDKPSNAVTESELSIQNALVGGKGGKGGRLKMDNRRNMGLLRSAPPPSHYAREDVPIQFNDQMLLGGAAQKKGK